MVFLMVQPLKKGDEPWGLKHCKAGIPEDEKYDEKIYQNLEKKKNPYTVQFWWD